MLSRFVEEGSKIELRALQRGLEEKGAESTAKVYQSRVLQILSEDTLEISMPMEHYTVSSDTICTTPQRYTIAVHYCTIYTNPPRN